MILLNNGRLLTKGSKVLYPMTKEARNIIGIIQEDASLNLSNTEVLASSFLVGRLIEEGLWDKIKALYGFIGGTAATHKWNWKDMRDLDVAYRLTYHGTINHSAYGIKGDGQLGSIANTYLNASILSLTSRHISLYTNTNETTSTGAGGFPVEVGASIANTNNFRLSSKWSDGRSNYEVSGLNAISSTSAIGIGFYLGNTFLGFNKLISNSNILSSNTIITSSLPNAYIGICGDNRSNTGIQNYLPSLKTIPFVSIGEGLTDQQAISMSNIVTTYNQILGRA